MKILVIFLFIGAASAIKIGCTFSMRSFTNVGTHYSCDVVSMDLSGNSTHVTQYNGTHLSTNTSSSVGGIYIANCQNFNLTTFPLGFSSLFPNIAAIYIVSCGFKELSGNELREYPALTYFRASSGPLVRVSGNLFAFNPRLLHVDLRSNQIEHVGRGLLDRSQNLLFAYFLSNVCINLSAVSAPQLLALKEALYTQCPDNEPETTPAPRPDRCFDDFIENYICDLSSNYAGLDRKLDILEIRVRHLEGFSDQVEELKTKNSLLEKENKEIRAEMEEMWKELREIKIAK